MHTGMILINLQKALDTLDHKILIENMTCLGFKTSVNKWFEFYLSSRKFYVFADNIFLEGRILNCVVSQGSGLGPLLLLIFLNNLLQSLSESVSYVYAGSTCIFYQNKDIQNWRCSNYRILNTMRLICDKKLSIHFEENKTKCILFSKAKRLSKFNITYGNNNIKQCHTEEYLGCHLNSNPRGRPMAMKDLKKINAKLVGRTNI